jgi:hypothetical protein
MADRNPGEETTTEPTRELPAEAATAPAAAPERHTGRVITARVLVVVATLLGIVAIFSAWAYRQLLDTEQWTKTSTDLLENKAVRDQVSTYLVDELYTNVDVTAQLQQRLPSEVSALAPVLAGALRNALDDVAKRALESPKVQGIWTDANRTAHQQLVKVVEGGGPNVSTQGGVVTLNLERMLVAIGERVGIPQAVLGKIPASAANVQILRSDELAQAQDAAKLLKALGLWLGFIVVLLFAIAVWLARGRRRQTLMFVGIGFIVAGLTATLIRGVAGGAVVDDLAPNASVQPAATAVWDIGTSLLHTLALQAVILGIATLIAAWMAGPSSWATSLRHALAPTLRDRPEIAYLVVAAVYLLLVVWAPLPAMRRPLFLLILAILLGLGVFLLRRQTQEEFPASAEDLPPASEATTAVGPGPGADG